jgi:hypothetical protein
MYAVVRIFSGAGAKDLFDLLEKRSHADYAARPRGGHLRAVWRTLRITSELSCTL